MNQTAKTCAFMRKAIFAAKGCVFAKEFFGKEISGDGNVVSLPIEVVTVHKQEQNDDFFGPVGPHPESHGYKMACSDCSPEMALVILDDTQKNNGTIYWDYENNVFWKLYIPKHKSIPEYGVLGELPNGMDLLGNVLTDLHFEAVSRYAAVITKKASLLSLVEAF